MKAILVCGARPNFMKIAPLLRAIARFNEGSRPAGTVGPDVVESTPSLPAGTAGPDAVDSPPSLRAPMKSGRGNLPESGPGSRPTTAPANHPACIAEYA